MQQDEQDAEGNGEAGRGQAHAQDDERGRVIGQTQRRE
jgi:hypothetical protein